MTDIAEKVKKSKKSVDRTATGSTKKYEVEAFLKMGVDELLRDCFNIKWENYDDAEWEPVQWMREQLPAKTFDELFVPLVSSRKFLRVGVDKQYRTRVLVKWEAFDEPEWFPVDWMRTQFGADKFDAMIAPFVSS